MSATEAGGLPLAVTMGDPAGIGPEIILKAWRARAAGARIAPFAVFGDAQVLVERAETLGLPVATCEMSSLADATAAFGAALPVVPVPLAVRAVAGSPDSRNAAAVIGAIRAAVAAVWRGEAAGVVTAPIAKHVLYQAGFAHPGHTEFLAELAREMAGGRTPLPVMMLAGPTLKVVPLTIHVPLARVPQLISVELIERTVRVVADAMRRDFALPRPRIAVAGLNPHAGEGGSIGSEETAIIAPAIARLAASGMNVSGPHSADTLFHDAARERYDVAVCMYHDQALIPIKTLAFDTGVNVTLGLPFVRTSPDHGTAFDIAAQGIARPTSMICALQMAAAIAHNRTHDATAPAGR